MGFWFAFFLFIGTSIVNALMAKHPPDAQAAGSGDFNLPTAQEGRVIPVVYGTCKLSGPNVVWWGGLDVQAIKQTSGGFLGIGAKKVTIGYKYFCTLCLALCHGVIDELIDIRVGEKTLNFSLNVNLVGGTYNVPALTPAIPKAYVAGGQKFTLGFPAETMFGGEQREGGLAGDIMFYFGDQVQAADARVNTAWGGTGPAWRGLTYARFTGYIGTSQYIKPWAFTVRRCPTPASLDSLKANINGDANPAYIALDLLTNATYGLGLPTARIDLTSFQAAANTLFTEGFGMSIVLDNEASADAVLGDILRTVDGVIFTDPATGLWTIKLARFDYVPASLTELTADDLLEAPTISRGSWSETLNEIKVSYTDRAANFTERVVQAQDTANWAVRGEAASETLTFRGISNATIALNVAARELKTHSYPLAQIRLKVNRKGWALRPGSPFRLTWQPPVGPSFSGMVCRVTSIRYGALEAGEIEIECVEDVFSVAYTAYSDGSGSGWTDPLSAPSSATAVRGEEAPYHLVGESRYVMANATRGDTTSYRGEIWTSQSGGYVQSGELQSLTPTGLLAAPYTTRTAANDPTGFTLSSPIDLSRLVERNTDAPGLLRGDNLAVIGNEWISWQTCVDNLDGTYTFTGILRGVLDTVPEDHAAGDRVWFVSDGSATTREAAFTADQTETFKITMRNSVGESSLAAAAAVPVTTTSRGQKPYPPGNVILNGSTYETWWATTLNDLTLSWNHRNRVSQGVGGAMVKQDTGGTYTPEGTYTVEVLVGGVVKQTYAGLTGLTQSYTALQRIADDTDGTKSVTFRITPVNGSLQGTKRTTPPVVMTGFGMNFGLYFGGQQA